MLYFAKFWPSFYISFTNHYILKYLPSRFSCLLSPFCLHVLYLALPLQRYFRTSDFTTEDLTLICQLFLLAQ